MIIVMALLLGCLLSVSASSVDFLHACIKKDPQNPRYYKELIQELRTLERYEQACTYLHTLASLEPSIISHYFDLGCLYTLIGKTDQAIEAYRKVLAHAPNQVQVLYNVGYALKMQGNFDEAIAVFKKILTIDPTYDNAEFALSRAYLQKGEFHLGWQHSIPYFKKSNKYAPELRALLAQGPLHNKRILCVPEGGLGDTLQFVRYAAEFKRRGAQVIVIAQKPLIPLLSRCAYIDELLPLGSQLPAYDARVTLMSAPAVLDHDEKTIPHQVPYIFPDPYLIELWRNKINPQALWHIGICWQADVYNDSSRPPVARRGIPLFHFFELSTLNNIQFYSLQQYDGIDQLAQVPDYFPLTIFDQDFDKTHGNFMDTAALMMHLDLIITVDTSIAHIAGALGRPVILLLPYATDWRWLAHRVDTPWYPTMKIFQQPYPFDWESVMHAVKSYLVNRYSAHNQE